MAASCLRLWRNLGSPVKVVCSVSGFEKRVKFCEGYDEFGPIQRYLKSLCTKAASQNESDSIVRGRRIAGSQMAGGPRFTNRKVNSPNDRQEVSNFKTKRSFGAESTLSSRNKGRNACDQTDSSRKVEKPSVYTTSDFADYRGMQLVFLGTSSSIPTLRRNTSCIALRLEGSIFLFDCGEGAVRQILRTPMKHYDIGNIFVTHMHGDHRYMDYQEGLLCRLGLKEFQSKGPIQVYGPQGLRQWIRTTLNASHARVHPKYAVHELHLRKKSTNVANSWNYVDEYHEDELPGRDIQRSPDGLWEVLKDERYTVRASFLRHSIPCWGYVVEEHTRRGRFDVERAREHGVRPGKYFRMLEGGDSVMLADGKIVYPSDVLGPPRRGRKVVILGDTCDSKSMIAAAQEANVVVHEATVLEQDASEVLQRGHSTAKMAGEFARAINAGTLVLTHFSRKLDGALFVDERSQVRETIGHLVSSAQEAFEKDNVIAAEDMMAITIQLEDKPPLKDAQHLTSASLVEEGKPYQKRVLGHAPLSEPEKVSTSKDFCPRHESTELGEKSLTTDFQRRTSRSQVQEKPKKNEHTRHLLPAQLEDKSIFRNLQKRRSSPRRPSTCPE